MRISGVLASVWICLILCSCGYHFESSETFFKTTSSSTLSIPFVEGDSEGRFTSELIYTLSSYGKWKYVQSGGDLILKVSILDQKNEEVGYNRANQNGQFVKWLVPNENRLSILAQVELIDSATQKTLLGPEYISSSVVYDYDPDFNTQNFVRFSLAQYNFQEVSGRTAKMPLERRLAQSIVDYLNFGW